MISPSCRTTATCCDHACPELPIQRALETASRSSTKEAVRAGLPSAASKSNRTAAKFSPSMFDHAWLRARIGANTFALVADAILVHVELIGIRHGRTVVLGVRD